MPTRLVPILAAAALAVACGAQSSGSGDAGGLYGTVVVKPATPTCMRGDPCTRRAAGFRLVFVSGARRVAVVADAAGEYRVALPAGAYGVRRVEPASVTVPSGRFARRNFTFDAGIR